MELNPLAREILKLLLASEEPLLARIIAEQLGVSTRMVQYHMHQAEEFLDHQGVQLIVKPNYGYSLRLDQKQRNALRLWVDRIPSQIYHLSAQDRVNVLLFIFLTNDEPVVLKQLERQLGVSKATLIKDMDSAERQLDQDNLTLIRKPGFGYQLLGSEADIRAATVRYFINLVGVLPLAMICRQTDWSNIQINLHSPLQEMVLEYLENLQLNNSWHITKELSTEYSLAFSDQSFVNLVLHQALQMQRIHTRHFVRLPLEGDIGNLSQNERSFTKLLSKKLAFHYKQVLPDPEEKYLAHLVISSEWEFENPLQEIEQTENREIAYAHLLTNMVLVEAGSLLHPVLQAEPKLRSEIQWMIYRILRRTKFGLSVQYHPSNPEATKHPLIFGVTKKIAAMLEKQLNQALNQEDLNTLTTYFVSAMERIFPVNRKIKVVVICGAGFAFSSLLRSRLSREFPDLDFVGQMGIVQYLEAPPNSIQVNVIISTVPIRAGDTPVIVVQPILTEEDITHIRQVLNVKQRSIIHEQPANMARMVDLFTPPTIALDQTANTWQDVVKYGGQLLVNSGAVSYEYVQAMVRIIEEFGPYVVSGEGIALLHARPDQGARRLAMAFARFQPAVAFGHAVNDPVDIAFVLSTPNEYSHLGALENYVELLSRKDLQDQLRQSQSKTDVLAVLNELGKTSK